jgi:predicted DNA-binding transcriptional regulator AlpA
MELPATYYINPKSLITAKEVCQILKISLSSLYLLIKADRFPKPLRMRDKPKTKLFWTYQSIIDFINKMNEKNE